MKSGGKFSFEARFQIYPIYSSLAKFPRKLVTQFEILSEVVFVNYGQVLSYSTFNALANIFFYRQAMLQLENFGSLFLYWIKKDNILTDTISLYVTILSSYPFIDKIANFETQ